MKEVFKSKKAEWRVETIRKNGVSLISNMTVKGYFLIIICIPLYFASCSTAKIYTKPDALSYTMNHKTLAILPPRVHLEVKKKDNLENKQAQEMTESVDAQNEMYSRFLNFVQKRNIYIDIQPIEKTNATFIETGYPYAMPPEELAKALGVDAILYTDCVYSSTHQVAGGLAFAIIFFPYGTVYGIMLAAMPTNYADLNTKLYDGKTGYLLFSYNNKFQGLNTKHIVLIDNATKKIVKKMPYYRK